MGCGLFYGLDLDESQNFKLMVVRIFNRKYLLLIGQGCCRVLLVTLRAPLPTIMCGTGRSTYMPGNVRGI